MKHILCFDFGGTAIKYGVAGRDGKIAEKGRFSSCSTLSQLLAEIRLVYERLVKGYALEGIAISSCGAVDPKSGIIQGVSALPYIHGFSWKETIRELLALPCEIENDANCAALSELMFGTDDSFTDACFLVIGTGIGGAVVLDRKIYHGLHFHAGEFGMMLQQLQDGTIKSFSECASTASMVRKLKEAYPKEEWNGIRIFEEAEKDNAFCKRVIREYYDALALGIFNLQHILDVERIFLGGSVSERKDFAQQVANAYERLRQKLPYAGVECVLQCCTHRQDANLLGALAHYLSRQK